MFGFSTCIGSSRYLVISDPSFCDFQNCLRRRPRFSSEFSYLDFLQTFSSFPSLPNLPLLFIPRSSSPMAYPRTSDPFAATGHNTIVRSPSPSSPSFPCSVPFGLCSHQEDTIQISTRRLQVVLEVHLELMRRVLQQREFHLQLWDPRV